MSFTPKRTDNKPETKTINKRVFRDLNIRGLPSSRPVIFSQAKGYVDKRPTRMTDTLLIQASNPRILYDDQAKQDEQDASKALPELYRSLMYDKAEREAVPLQQKLDKEKERERLIQQNKDDIEQYRRSERYLNEHADGILIRDTALQLERQRQQQELDERNRPHQEILDAHRQLLHTQHQAHQEQLQAHHEQLQALRDLRQPQQYPSFPSPQTASALEKYQSPPSPISSAPIAYASAAAAEPESETSQFLRSMNIIAAPKNGKFTEKQTRTIEDVLNLKTITQLRDQCKLLGIKTDRKNKETIVEELINWRKNILTQTGEGHHRINRHRLPVSYSHHITGQGRKSIHSKFI